MARIENENAELRRSLNDADALQVNVLTTQRGQKNKSSGLVYFLSKQNLR